MYSVITRRLTGEEAQELLDYMSTLTPAYTMDEDDQADRIQSGGSLSIGFMECHRKESTYVKLKWG